MGYVVNLPVGRAGGCRAALAWCIPAIGVHVLFVVICRLFAHSAPVHPHHILFAGLATFLLMFAYIARNTPAASSSLAGLVVP